MANSGQTSKKTAANRKSPTKPKYVDNEGLIPNLAKAVREVEKAAQRGKVPTNLRHKFLVAALLMREEHARVLAEDLPEAERKETLRRLDGIAGILAQTVALDTSLMKLLDTDQPLPPAAQQIKRDILMKAGAELDPDDLIVVTPEVVPDPELEKQVTPQSVVQKSMLNPFLAPEVKTQPSPPVKQIKTLSNWELLGPLFKAFETGAGGGAASMALPEPLPIDRKAPQGVELMEHQVQFIASVRRGHRTFLLADEPGLGKTAQSLLSASAAGAFPLLAVVPNVVKMNWAREASLWTPNRRVTVVHGDGDDVDAFADIVIVNYDILDRHVGWLSKQGFKSMVIDEAHFIKNPESHRSKNVMKIAENIRLFSPGRNPLMIALTGTPLINSIEDFKMIWQFLGWIDDKKPLPKLMEKLEETGLSPADPGFLAAARQVVIDMGIVRRRKIDVAKDLPSKRIANLPVELDDSVGRSIQHAELELAARLLRKFRALKEARGDRPISDADLIRAVAVAELEESKSEKGTGENVFTMIRRIGQAKASLAADYTAQLAGNVGKVVFFAKHIDVLDTAEEILAKRGLKTVSIRGGQTSTERQQAIDAFTNDKSVSVVICSLTAAGVGVNLQASSNVVLAELSWTAAEQEQAIDRVHRIGQDEPVTAWRILAAQTIDSKIAELIDSKSGLAARALDGAPESEPGESVQLAALMLMLEEALKSSGGADS